MARMLKGCHYLGVTILTGCFSAIACAEDRRITPSATFSLLSDYRYRGISYSNKDPVVQVNFTASHDSGFYAGTFFSNIADYGGSELEIDLYAGYATEISGFAVDLTAYQYVYPGGKDVNYAELTAKVSKEIKGATVWAETWYVPDQKNTPSDNLYAGMGIDVPLPGLPLTFRLRGGWDDGFYDNKLDWETRLTAKAGRLEIYGAVTGTHAKRIEVGNMGGTTFVGGVTARF